MGNSNPNAENMSKAEVSEIIDPEHGSIDEVTARLLRFSRLATQGLAIVEFRSIFAQREVLNRLREGLKELSIPFHEIMPEPGQHLAADQVRHLMRQFSAFESGVVSLTGLSEMSFPEDIPLVDSLRIFNFNRENLAHFPLSQIWWVSPSFAQAIRQSIPDLYSWFILKLHLIELPANPELNGWNEVDYRFTLPEDEAERSADYFAERFRNALKSQFSLDELADLLVDAIHPLLNAGKIDKATHLHVELLEKAAKHCKDILAYLLEQKSNPTILIKIGNLYLAENRYDTAELLLKRALTLQRLSLPANHPEIAVNLNNLALLYVSLKRYDEAEPLYNQALDILQETVPTDIPTIALSLNNLAGLYFSQGHISEAEALLKKSLKLRRDVLETNDANIAQSLNNLALVYKNQGVNSEAELLYKQALEIRRSALPASHPNVATSLNNLAILYRSEQRYSEAESLFREAVDNLIQSLGSENRYTISAIKNHIYCMREMGILEETLPSLPQAYHDVLQK